MDTLLTLFDTVYPRMNFTYIEIQDDKYFVIPDRVHEKVKININSISIRQILSPQEVGFKVKIEDRYILVKCLKSVEEMEINDPCMILASQFNVHSLFDIIGFIHQDYSIEYFNGLKAIMEYDFTTAAYNLGIVSEHLSLKILKDTIPDTLKGQKGIKEIRKYLESHEKLYDLINMLKLILRKIKISDKRKTILNTLYYELHLLRELRNRVLHPESFFGDYEVSQMVSLMCLIVKELHVFIDDSNMNGVQ